VNNRYKAQRSAEAVTYEFLAILIGGIEYRQALGQPER
jgi:hypothetical protein